MQSRLSQPQLQLLVRNPGLLTLKEPHTSGVQHVQVICFQARIHLPVLNLLDKILS